MKFIRVKAVARKEFIHIVRDPRSLGMAIAIPMLLLFLFGYALALDVDRVPLMVWDQSQTPASREFLTYFTGSRYFSLQRYASGYPELERALDANEVLVGLVIPRDFAERARTRAPVRVQAIVDGSDSNTATISMGYLNAISLAYSNQVLLEETRRITGKTPAPPVDLRPRVWFNADLESRNYIIPGLTAVIMMVIAALLTSLTVAKEWEQGTMEQLISTPVKETELVVGKLLPYFAIGMLDVLLAVLMGAYVFEVPLRGSVPLLFGVSAVFLAGALSMGMLISIAAKSQLLASQLAMILTFLPSFLLSGFMYATANMPRAVQVVTYLVPARYFVALLKGIYLKGVGLEVLGVQAGMLAAFSGLMIALAILKFEKRLD
ncbi:MAG TPA: ABC transporter permease [Candidatus Hydrogenedentes bacterium]|jgi:ABC-2 type transport system permease protein|nr:ABC transporter permease [Candidatus Hydrogenedentota bacterium]